MLAPAFLRASGKKIYVDILAAAIYRRIKEEGKKNNNMHLETLSDHQNSSIAAQSHSSELLPDFSSSLSSPPMTAIL